MTMIIYVLFFSIFTSVYSQMGFVNCFGYNDSNPLVCSQHGMCLENNYCDCYGGYAGQDCSTVVYCNGVPASEYYVCSGVGYCNYGLCQCNVGHYGVNCENNYTCNGIDASDYKVCNSSGSCYSQDNCTCWGYSYGKYCENATSCFGIFAYDPAVCNGNGYCYTQDVCSCYGNYTTADCYRESTFDEMYSFRHWRNLYRDLGIEGVNKPIHYQGSYIANDTNSTYVYLYPSPGGRIYATTWIAEFFYLIIGFGEGYVEQGVYGYFNDMWAWDTMMETWEFLKGSTTLNAPEINIGSNSSYNNPCARTGALGWTHTLQSHMLYLFGGAEPSDSMGMNPTLYLNDLWVYEKILSMPGIWQRISGDEGNSTTYSCYENQGGSSSSGCVPIKRAFSTSQTGIYLENGNTTKDCVYIFGGNHPEGFESRALDDFFVFFFDTHEWIWLKGGNFNYDSVGYYHGNNTMNISHVNNNPSGRWGAMSWFVEGNFYLFGGKNVNNAFSDLWAWHFAYLQWRKLSKGAGESSSEMSYYDYEYSSQNMPNSRAFGCAWAFDDYYVSGQRELFFFGGETGSFMYTNEVYNSVWVYDLDLMEWSLSNGSLAINQSDTYDYTTFNYVNSDTDVPEKRQGHACWDTLSNVMYLYGGEVRTDYYSRYLVDVWMFQIYDQCNQPPMEPINYTRRGINAVGTGDILFYEKGMCMLKIRPPIWIWVNVAGIILGLVFGLLCIFCCCAVLFLIIGGTTGGLLYWKKQRDAEVAWNNRGRVQARQPPPVELPPAQPPPPESSSSDDENETISLE